MREAAEGAAVALAELDVSGAVDGRLLGDDDLVGAHLEELGDVEQHRHDHQREQVVSEKGGFVCYAAFLASSAS